MRSKRSNNSPGAMNRRTFLRLSGFGISAAALIGCNPRQANKDADARVASVNTIPDLRTLGPDSQAGVVQVKGYYAPGDGGGGQFYWDAASAAAHDGGLALVPISNPTRGRWIRTYEGPLNVLWFGAKGDGTTNDSSALQAALNAAAGSNLLIPPGDYLVSNTLSVPENTTISAYGARIFDTRTHRSLVKVLSGVTIRGLELQGAGNSAYDARGIGINAMAPNSSSYYSNITLEEMYVHDFGRMGIEGRYVRHLRINRCRVYSIGYAGIGIDSGTDVVVDGCHVKTISPGTEGNSYNIFFSRRGGTDLSAEPKSLNCSVVKSLIEDNPLWDGLDVHGAENTLFASNTVRNCIHGISLVSSHEDNVSDYAPLRCRVIGNRLKDCESGIDINGSSDEPGRIKQYASGCEISGNTLVGCGGPQGNSSGGVIILVATSGCIVKGNTLVAPSNNGIHLYRDNIRFVIKGNRLIDPLDSHDTAPPGILLRAGNKGVISGNSLSVKKASDS